MSTLFFNGTIHTLDPAFPSPQAVRVGGHGRIEALGLKRDLDRPGVAHADLAGRTLIPGFNDAHCHVSWLGLLLTRWVNAHAAVAPDIPAIVDRFRSRALAQPAGTWIQGVGYNEALLPEGRHPNRADLDQASAERPLFLIRSCGHIAVANSLALRLAGVTAQTPDPRGGLIDRDERGEPTGILKETAMALVAQAIPEIALAEMREALDAAFRHQLSLGITSATDAACSPFEVRVYRAMDEGACVAVRTNLLFNVRDGEQIYPLPERYVSDALRLDTCKFFADGGMTSATAAISLPYRELDNHGILICATEELAGLMGKAHAAGYRLATHANGDVALDQVIGIYEALDKREPRSDSPFRLEHMALPTPQHLARCRKLGVMVATQPVFLSAMGATFRRYMPEPYFDRAYGVRSMLDAGLTVALSTDCPVVPDDNPLLGLKAAVDRLDHRGVPLGKGQAIQMREALYAYTMAGAILSGDGANRGSITPGKWADLAVLSGDPLAVDPQELPGLQVEQTYVAGRLVFER
jgi:predicted amidohydrolase YtcJ